MNYQEVSKLVTKEIIKSGYKYKETWSKSTSSLYYDLYSNGRKLHFRISDHKTKTSTITFRMDHKNSYESLIRFVRNRINDMGKRVTKNINYEELNHADNQELICRFR